jgi:hypothetical protein
LYVAPHKKNVSSLDQFKKKKKKRGSDDLPGQLWDSSMEEPSSEEDFEYLHQYLEEHKTLPPGSMKLLRGVVSAQYNDRKFPGRFGRG